MAMFHRSNTKRRERVESRPRSRRLAIEALESRRLLSNNQLDYNVWNLDSLQDDYAIISDGGTLAETRATPKYRDAGGIRLNLEWVVVPGMSLSTAEANQLAFRHWQSAVTAGTFTADEIMPLYTRWQDTVARNAGLDSAPVYAIGVKGLDTMPSIDNTSMFSGPGYIFGSSSWPSIVVNGNVSFGAFDTAQLGVARNTIKFHVVRSDDLSGFAGDADSSFEDAMDALLDGDGHVAGWNRQSPIDVFATVPVVPRPIEPPSVPAPSDSLAGLGDAVNDLLSQDVIIDSQSDMGLLGSPDIATSAFDSPMAANNTEAEVSGTAATVSEGGMVSVEVIVATVAEGSLPIAPVDADVAAGVDGLEIGGELARVAVMELIEGATEPTAPAIGHDSITVLAMNDAAGAVMQFVSTRGGQGAAGEWIAGIEYVADQAGSALAMILPGDAAQIASIASAAGNLLASIALPGFSGPLAGAEQDSSSADTAAGEGARAALFSALGEEREEALVSLGREHLAWLAAVPVAALLAAERLMAPRKKVPPKSASAPVATS